MHGTANLLTDHLGQTIRLGQRVGRGGEGEVFEIAGFPGIVAKVYHQPLTADRAAKIIAMIPLATGGIRDFCAWPTGLILEGRQFRGILMPFIKGRKELHLLHGPKSRKAEFPDAGFGFLVRVAANIARAMASIHAAGVVIGDINDRGFLVGRDGIVTLIDCDSFQVITPKKAFLCDVGVANFTPPELQGQNLRGVRRTTQHDAFGLAVLVFLLIFMGRHPFAGRYALGSIELEVAIKEYRYAYSSDAARTGMEAPPNTLAIESGAGSEIVALFERAFAPSAARSQPRPSATEWIRALERLEKTFVPCNWNRAHVYSRAQSSCPWCTLEQRAGVDLFPFLPTDQPEGLTVAVEAVLQALGALQMPAVPKAKPAPHFSVLTPRPLPTPLAEKVTRYQNLEFEANRARDVARTAGSRAETAENMRAAIDAALANADPKLRSLKELRDRSLPNDTAHMLFLAASALFGAGFAADGLSAALGTKVLPGQAFVALLFVVGAYHLMRRRYLVWRRASAGTRFMTLLRATADAKPVIRAQINDCTTAATEARAEQERATKIADVMDDDRRALQEEIQRDVDILKAELDCKVSECSAELRGATDALAKVEACAKELEAELRSRQASAAQSIKHYRNIEAERRADQQKLRDSERMQQLDNHLDRFFIDQAPIQGITRCLVPACDGMDLA